MLDGINLISILISNYDGMTPRKVNKPYFGLGMDYVAKILMANKVDTF